MTERGYTNIIEDYLRVRDLINSMPSGQQSDPLHNLTNEARKTMDALAVELEGLIIDRKALLSDVLRLMCIKFEVMNQK